MIRHAHREKTDGWSAVVWESCLPGLSQWLLSAGSCSPRGVPSSGPLPLRQQRNGLDWRIYPRQYRISTSRPQVACSRGNSGFHSGIPQRISKPGYLRARVPHPWSRSLTRPDGKSTATRLEAEPSLPRSVSLPQATKSESSQAGASSANSDQGCSGKVDSCQIAVTSDCPVP